jgi:hypothetical protein
MAKKAAATGTATGHEIVAKTAFELVGVALLAILADTNKALGNVLVLLMVAFGVIWLMNSGSAFLAPIIGKFSATSTATASAGGAGQKKKG